ncbi:MAG: zinc finger CCCH domain-containing protein [Sphingobacteriaceae bacterium]|nr:MAG: zinc finger CCCH domain-containing protein [Sphingobacteriaceae bacterium]
MYLLHFIWIILLSTVQSGPTLPTNHKTKLCSTYTITGHCRYDERCTYAHGSDELRRHTFQGSSDIASQTIKSTVTDHESRMVELESDLERAWQHILRLETDVAELLSRLV